MSQSTKHGKFGWYDLMTTDHEAGQEFYSRLVGWGTTEWEGGEQPYTMFTNNDVPGGGYARLPDEALAAGVPSHWVPYVLVSDVDDTVAKATQLGGSVIHPATDIPEAGRFAWLADPQGAEFAIFASAIESPPAEDRSPQVGEFSWHELATTDQVAAFNFYSDLFGWEKTDTMDMGEAGIYQMYGRPGGCAPLGGIFDKPAEAPASNWLLYVRVADLDAAVDTVKASGGQVLSGPMDVPGGDRVAQCSDPQGAAFALHESAASEPAAAE